MNMPLFLYRLEISASEGEKYKKGGKYEEKTEKIHGTIFV